MILQYAKLTTHPAVFRSFTGLTVAQFDALLADALPRYRQAERIRHSRPDRLRAIGGGSQFALALRDHLLLTVVWLRVYPTYPVLGYLFGVSEYVAQRALGRVLPVLEAAGLDTLRLPDPGRGHRRTLDDLLREIPDLALLVDTYEQPVQRHKQRQEADRYYSGKKKRHTIKTQVVVTEWDERIVDVAPSEPGPTADITVLRQSGFLARVPEGVGVLGDLAYVGMTEGYAGCRGGVAAPQATRQATPTGGCRVQHRICPTASACRAGDRTAAPFPGGDAAGSASSVGDHGPQSGGSGAGESDELAAGVVSG